MMVACRELPLAVSIDRWLLSLTSFVVSLFIHHRYVPRRVSHTLDPHDESFPPVDLSSSVIAHSGGGLRVDIKRLGHRFRAMIG